MVGGGDMESGSSMASHFARNLNAAISPSLQGPDFDPKEKSRPMHDSSWGMFQGCCLIMPYPENENFITWKMKFGLFHHMIDIDE